MRKKYKLKHTGNVIIKSRIGVMTKLNLSGDDMTQKELKELHKQYPNLVEVIKEEKPKKPKKGMQIIKVDGVDTEIDASISAGESNMELKANIEAFNKKDKK